MSQCQCVHVAHYSAGESKSARIKLVRVLRLAQIATGGNKHMRKCVCGDDTEFILRWGTWPWEMNSSCSVPHLHGHTVRQFLLKTMLHICNLVTSGYRILFFQKKRKKEARSASNWWEFYTSLMHVLYCKCVRVCVSEHRQGWEQRSSGRRGVVGVGGVGESFSWPLSPLWTLFSACDWLTPRHCH